jgi:hypothetical protein
MVARLIPVTDSFSLQFWWLCAGPLVLLLHGFPDFWFSWRYQISALVKAGFHVVAPDMRGFGQTEAPVEPEKYTVFDITGDLIGLIDVLGARKVSLCVLVLGDIQWCFILCFFLIAVPVMGQGTRGYVEFLLYAMSELKMPYKKI